ncbi:oligosaccharide flippase family protein [Rhodocaloribacter litoris]|uniref:lipopolysaccharide biosynthesis protein n=1 Tax=Rhodocaloribacter litoris TaxID=2558931 RepID=UPI001423F0DD|nr:oligosaccharide flippase family protein [Rhodocaloribacter litoris]QXD14855.1 oligosaccharide flippase family protein [Rhodocaloribacter litoris]
MMRPLLRTLGRLTRPFTHLFAPGSFRTSVLTLLSGTALALALAYLARPVLTRLYTPAAFGLADVFVALVGMLLPLASLRYEDALMLPEDDREAVSVLGLSALLTGAFVLVTAGLLFWRDDLAAWLGAPALAPWLWLLPPALLAMRAAKLAEVWLTRNKRFRPISAGQVTQTATMVLTRIGAGLPPWRAGAGGLIGGFVLGHAAAAVVLAGAVLYRSAPLLRNALRWTPMWAAARRYRRFPAFSMPSALLGALVTRLPFLLLLAFFDQAVVGHFGLAFNALLIPLSLIGGAVAQVFFVHAAEAHRHGTLPDLTATVHRRLVMAGLFPTLALLLAGPDVFAFVFSEAWRTAGSYVQRVGPWLFLSAVASPLTRLFDVLERQRLDLLTSLLMFLVLVGALVIGGRSGNAGFCLLLVGIAGGAARLGQLLVLLRLGAVPWPAVLRPYGRYLLLGLPGLGLIAAALPAGHPWLTTLALAAGGLTYGLLVLRYDRLLAPGAR